MSVTAKRVADRYMCRLASRQVCASTGFTTRTAALHDLTPQVLEAFAEGFLLHEGHVASLGNMIKKLGKLVDFFKKAPKAWEGIKHFLGIQNLTDIPKAIKEWAQRGLTALKNYLHKATQTFPISLYFVSPKRAPNLTKVIHQIAIKHPGIAKALEGIRSFAGNIDQWFDKYMPTLKKPLLAAIFIWIWVNVAELTWDFTQILAGFTGNISFGDLLGSLPESGIGLLASAAGVGYMVLPVALIARLLWLVSKKYLVWESDKRGLLVRWDLIADDEHVHPEFIPVF